MTIRHGLRRQDALTGSLELRELAGLPILRAGLDDRLGALDELPVECVLKHRRGRLYAVARRAVWQFDVGEHMGEVHAARLPVLDRPLGAEQVDAADRLVQRAQ